MERGRIRQQPRIAGQVRAGRHAGLLPSIDGRVADAMRRFRVSRSFVIATALGDYFGVAEQPDYAEPAPPANGSRKTRTRRGRRKGGR